MSLEKIKSVGVIGYGRFGKLLASLIKQNYPAVSLSIFSNSNNIDQELFFDLETVCSSALIIPCVPISNFEETIKKISEFLHSNQIVMDVCSVKIYPRDILLKLVSDRAQIVGSHPMFGPATYEKRGNSIEGLQVVLDNINCSAESFAEIEEFWKNMGLNLVYVEANEHDRLAAKFQFISLCTATMVRSLGLARSSIDTPSARAMLNFIEMISVDESLIRDLYNFNPYCKDEFKKLEGAFDSVRNLLTGQAG